MKFNPFRPNSITSSELFQGRKEDMNFIEQESCFYLRNSEDAIQNGAVVALYMRYKLFTCNL